MSWIGTATSISMRSRSLVGKHRVADHSRGSARLSGTTRWRTVERPRLQPANEHALRSFGGLVRHLPEVRELGSRHGPELHGRQVDRRPARPGARLADRYRRLDRYDPMAV